MLQKVLLIALAGALGTLARFGLGGLVQRCVSPTFPYGTLTVNLIGCFLFGLLWALALERYSISSETRSILLIGFMGAFTTFSTYVAETGNLLADAQWTTASVNIIVQNVGGLACFFLAQFVARWI
jgi:CrcB protein